MREIYCSNRFHRTGCVIRPHRPDGRHETYWITDRQHRDMLRRLCGHPDCQCDGWVRCKWDNGWEVMFDPEDETGERSNNWRVVNLTAQQTMMAHSVRSVWRVVNLAATHRAFRYEDRERPAQSIDGSRLLQRREVCRSEASSASGPDRKLRDREDCRCRSASRRRRCRPS